jgi:integrase
MTRHGRVVWYVRGSEPPRKKIRIRAEYGTPEFEEEYLAALNGEKPKPKAKARTGSLKWLYARYRETDAWFALAASTRKARENIFAHVMETGGDEPYAAIKRADIEEGKNRRRETPGAARDFLDTMRGLFRWAVEAGLVAVDPTAGVRNPKRKKSEGFKAWTLDDVARYEARWAPGTRQHVWLHVLLYIGCRRGDAVILGRQHVRDGIVSFVTEKGREKTRIEVSRRIEPELAATLAQGPCGDLAFICGERGAPLTKESFGNEFKAACVKAGILDKPAHGLRKLSATLWAKRGATEHELMAMFGWLTPAMAALYTRNVDRRRLAMSAAERLARTR